MGSEIMKHNQAKQRMLAGEPAIGTLVGAGSPLLAGLLSGAGFDFVLVDNQHGDWEEDTSLAAFRAIGLGGAVPMARVRFGDYTHIGRMLDRGALGIVVPMVNTVEDAQLVAYASHYPPMGGRSWAPNLAPHLGADYDTWVDRELLVMVQIETAMAVQNAPEILAVDGIDGCWIGPLDLARSLGVDLGTPDGLGKHEEAVLKVVEACRATHTIPGIYGSDATQARRWLDHGFQFVTAGGDTGFVVEGARQTLSQLRG